MWLLILDCVFLSHEADNVNQPHFMNFKSTFFFLPQEVGLLLAAILALLLAFYAFFYLRLSTDVDPDLEPDED